MSVRWKGAALILAAVAGGVTLGWQISPGDAAAAKPAGKAPEGKSRPKDDKLIPERLGRSMANSEEQYLAQLLAPIRRLAGSDQTLDKGDIERIRRRAEAVARARELSSLLKHDLNGDGVVTRTEIDESLPEGAPEHTRKRVVDRLLPLDLDHDGQIKIEEALKSVSKSDEVQRRGSRAADDLKSLLELDPNGDGRLTAAELKALGKAAFAHFDTDGDGVLSKDEMKAHSKYVSGLYKARMERRIRSIHSRQAAECSLPPAGRHDKIVVIAGYEARALSSVTVAGQNGVTETSSLRVEEGKSPLYIIATSYMPNIWRVSGKTGRISRFVAFPRGGNENEPNVGVVGLPKKRVTFLPGGSCFRYFKTADSGAGRQAKAIVEHKLKRPVETVIAAYALKKMSVPSGKSLSGNSRRFRSGGVVKIDAEKVIAPGKAHDYDVLPRHAGLIQLMKEGRIERLSDGIYYIKKPIPRYPAGLAGGYSVKFMLGKGIPTPEGSPGHSCVISEDTGAPLDRHMNSLMCR